jgi:hypothetical protein
VVALLLGGTTNVTAASPNAATMASIIIDVVIRPFCDDSTICNVIGEMILCYLRGTKRII